MTKVSRQLQRLAYNGFPAQPMALVYIDRGHYWSALVEDRALADNGSLEMLIVTGPDDGTRYSLAIGGSVGGDGEATLFEDTVVSANGAATLVSSRNRVINATAKTLVFSGPTVTTDGAVVIGPLFIPGGTGNKDSQGGTAAVADQFLLKPATNYLIRATNLAGSAQPADITAGIIEES